MTARIRIRRATQANWKSDNPTLDHGEIGMSFVGSLCVGFKVGDGSTVWNSLVLFKPPTIVEDGTDQTVNILWSDVARLAGDNTFTDGVHIFGPAGTPGSETPLTVKGKFTVTESSSSAADGDLTVSAGDVGVTAGDVTVTAGDISIPEYDGTEDENVLKGGSGTKGCLFMSANGPCLANGNLLGKAKDVSDTNFGPFVIVNEDKVVVGGYDSATASTGNQTTLEYGLQPENSSDLATLGGGALPTGALIIPTKKLVVDHVAATIPTFGNIFFTAEELASADGVTDFAGATGSGTTKFLQKAAAWGSKYLMLMFHFRTEMGSNGEDLKYELLLKDGGGDIISPADLTDEDNGNWYGDHGTGGGTEFYSTTGVITTTAALDADGKLQITLTETGNAASHIWIDKINWWASSSAIASDDWHDIEYTP